MNNSNEIFQSKTINIKFSCYSFNLYQYVSVYFFQTLTVSVNRYLIIKINM